MGYEKIRYLVRILKINVFIFLLLYFKIVLSLVFKFVLKNDKIN